jgi:hypothetical protein
MTKPAAEPSFSVSPSKSSIIDPLSKSSVKIHVFLSVYTNAKVYSYHILRLFCLSLFLVSFKKAAKIIMKLPFNVTYNGIPSEQ